MNKELSKAMGNRLKEIRKFYNMSQIEMAESFGMTQPGYWTYENGRHEFDYRFNKILEVDFNVNIDWFKTGEGNMISRKGNLSSYSETKALLDNISKLKVEFIELLNTYAKDLLQVQYFYENKNYYNRMKKERKQKEQQ